MFFIFASQLFLWVLDGQENVEEEETLDEAMARINTDINSLLPLENFILGKKLC